MTYNTPYKKFTAANIREMIKSLEAVRDQAKAAGDIERVKRLEGTIRILDANLFIRERIEEKE